MGAVLVGYGDGGSAKVFPIGVPVAVYSGYPQSEHVFRVLDAPPGAGPLETLLGDVAMRAFDFARSDRQSLGQRLSIVQLVLAAAQITMASAHRRVFVVDFRRFAMTDERPQCHLETPVSERVLLRLDPGFPRGGVGRDRFGGGAQILANMIEIDQVAALIAKLLLDLAHNPWRAIADRVDPRVRPEAGANRAGQQLPPGRLRAALDRAGVDRRPAPLGVRQRKLRLSPRQVLALAFVFLIRPGSTIGTMPPSVSTTIGLLRPGPSGNSNSARPASNIDWAWANVIRWIVLSPISKP